MRISEAMTREVRTCNPDSTLMECAQCMEEIDAGVVPVAENDRLVGMITDRDIAIRAIAQGKGPETPVREVMSPEVKYCYEDQELQEVARNMADIRVRRLPVLNREKRLVGIVSLGDVAGKEEKSAGKAVRGVSKQGGPHSQSARI